MRREWTALLGLLVLFILIMAGGWQLWNGYIIQKLALFRETGGIYLFFAFLGGVAGFFAPCAFALLPGYASYYLGLETGRGPAIIGVATALGVLAFYLALGAMVSALGVAVNPYLGYFKPLVGSLLLLLGVLLYSRSFNLGPLSTAMGQAYAGRKPGGYLPFFLFGAAYGATALACTLPLFLALVIYPLLSGKILLGFEAFSAYALAKAVLMVAVTYMVAYSKETLIKKLSVSTAKIKELSGVAIALIGLYLILSGGMG